MAAAQSPLPVRPQARPAEAQPRPPRARLRGQGRARAPRVQAHPLLFDNRLGSCLVDVAVVQSMFKSDWQGFATQKEK